jgi:hypothetical protein
MQLNRVRFPKRKPDGSFCVEVVFRVNSNELDALMSRVALWLEEWVRTNRFWKIGFAHPEAPDGMFDFLRDFAGPPTCSANGPDLICLRFEGRSGSKRAWRDWLAMRLSKELRGAFPEITALEDVRNCTSALREGT